MRAAAAMYEEFIGRIYVEECGLLSGLASQGNAAISGPCCSAA
jgi:hypothetical protein